MRERGSQWTILLIVACLLTALVINLYLLPENNLIAAFYAVGVLIAAQKLSPRAVIVVAVVAVLLYLLNVYVKGRSLAVAPVGVAALAIVSYLALQLSRQRRETDRRAREAEEARRSLQEYMGMVSHELGQPLTLIRGYAHLLNRSGAERPAPERKAVAAISDASARAYRLVNDLRDASRIGAGHFEVQPASADLAAVARQVVEEQQAATTRHELMLETPERLEGHFDGGRVGQLLTNLVSNAIKYSPEGGPVRITLEQRDGSAEMRVSDSGQGIPPEQQGLLFRPFSRLDQEQKGTGLGLYISRAIAEAHGGDIRVESERGRGSTFTVKLPLRAPS